MNINSHQFFDLLGEADSSYLAAAHKTMTAKPARMWFRPALIAACLTLVLVAIPVGILIGNRSETPQVPVIDPNTTSTTTAPHTTETPKASILDIPGATLFDENDERFHTEEKDSSFTTFYSYTDAQKREWVERVYKENDVIVGIIKDYISVIVPDGKDYYRVTTMEIAVLEDFSGMKCETIKAVYANRYQWRAGDYYPATEYIIGNGINQNTNEIVEDLGVSCDMFQTALTYTQHHNEGWDHAAFFLLKKATSSSFTIGENTYSLSDYANYVLDACLSYEIGWDRLDLANGAVHLTVPSGIFRELYFNLITFDCGRFSPFFYFENACEAFDHNTAICLTWNQGKENNLFYNSIFYDDLLINETDLEKRAINPEYKWVVTIDGVEYEITRFDLKNASLQTNIYLDLGPDFSFDLFDYNENNQYTFENVRLDIYDSEGNLFCYSPLTNNYRFPNGYTHTKPN